MIRTSIYLIFGAIVIGCFHPNYEDGIGCSEEGECPVGMACSQLDDRLASEGSGESHSQAADPNATRAKRSRYGCHRYPTSRFSSIANRCK